MLGVRSAISVGSSVRRLTRRLEQFVYSRLGRLGPYRFLFNPWKRISDIDLAARVVDVEFFRGPLVPLPLPVKDVKSILVLAPHQDDETIGAGGTMLLASQHGAAVTVLYLTDGMQTNLPYTAEESVRIRHKEAEEACSIAGATIRTVGIPNIKPRPTVEHVHRIVEVIREVRPEVIMTPWLLDAPAKHRMTNHLLWLANRQSRLPDCEVWGYQVHSGIIPNGYVDITSAMPEKMRMLEAFESQNSHSQCYDHLSQGLSAWNARFLPTELGSIRKRYAEVFFAVPLREHLDLTERFYFRNLVQTYGGNGAVIAGMRRIHADVS